MFWKIILILVVIAFLFYQFSGKILRFILRKAGKKLEKEMKKRFHEAAAQQQAQNQQTTHTVRNEQDENITITYVKEPKRHATKDFTEGEYIDFEEVKS